jgi:hypothetical protein
MQYDVPLVAQSTSMSCWAASMAMILAWRNQASFDPSMIAANNGGTSYMPQLRTGLDPNDRYILERNGFSLEEPQCYSVEGVADLLDRFGPLWVASAAPAPHIRVVTGMTGGRMHINDPAPVNQGARYDASFSQFWGAMESLGARERRERAPIYVAYMAS